MASTGTFSDEEFHELVKDLDEPDLEGYELLVEAHGIKFYRRMKSSGLFEYKGFGAMTGLDPETCAYVYTDIEYRREWDKRVLDLSVIKEQNGLRGLYWLLDYPFPLADRELTYVSEMRVFEVGGVKTWAMLSKYCSFPSVKPSRGKIWTSDFIQNCVVQGDGKGGSNVYIYCFDNPKGQLPASFVNWVAKTGVPSFLKNYKQAVLKYPQYLEKVKKREGLETLDNEVRIRRLHGEV